MWNFERAENFGERKEVLPILIVRDYYLFEEIAIVKREKNFLLGSRLRYFSSRGGKFRAMSETAGGQ